MVTILLGLESVLAVIADAIILQQMTGREYRDCVLMITIVLTQIPDPFEKKVKGKIKVHHK